MIVIVNAVTGERSAPRYVAGYCPSDNVEITVTAQDFKRLTLKPSVLSIAPDDLNGFVNLPVFIHTSAEPQRLSTQILGSEVLIEAKPISFTFEYGDDTKPHTTTHPGSPYPDTTNGHTYKRPGTYNIELVTTWSGEFSVNNGQTWTAIDGFNTTTTTPLALTIKESTPLLVD